MSAINNGDYVRASRGTVTLEGVVMNKQPNGDFYLEYLETLPITSTFWTITIIREALPPIGTLIKGALEDGDTFAGVVTHEEYAYTVQTSPSGSVFTDPYTYWEEMKEFEVVG